MKKYILTIEYDEDSDTVEWLQEEIIVEDKDVEITSENIAQLTSEDLLEIMYKKQYAKA
mgnify:CR=1 FL=1